MEEWRLVSLKFVAGAWFLLDDENGLARDFDTIEDAMMWLAQTTSEYLINTIVGYYAQS